MCCNEQNLKNLHVGCFVVVFVGEGGKWQRCVLSKGDKLLKMHSWKKKHPLVVSPIRTILKKHSTSMNLTFFKIRKSLSLSLSLSLSQIIPRFSLSDGGIVMGRGHLLIVHSQNSRLLVLDRGKGESVFECWVVWWHRKEPCFRLNGHKYFIKIIIKTEILLFLSLAFVLLKRLVNQLVAALSPVNH